MKLKLIDFWIDLANVKGVLMEAVKVAEADLVRYFYEAKEVAEPFRQGALASGQSRLPILISLSKKMTWPFT